MAQGRMSKGCTNTTHNATILYQFSPKMSNFRAFLCPFYDNIIYRG
nr:MAG TPA: hypothetical protein [Bacteriophage sp.]